MFCGCVIKEKEQADSSEFNFFLILCGGWENKLLSSQAVCTVPEVTCLWEGDRIWSFWNKIQGREALDHPSTLV